MSSKWDGELRYRTYIEVVFEYDAQSPQDAGIKAGELMEQVRGRVNDMEELHERLPVFVRTTFSTDGPEIAIA